MGYVIGYDSSRFCLECKGYTSHEVHESAKEGNGHSKRYVCVECKERGPHFCTKAPISIRRNQPTRPSAT